MIHENSLSARPTLDNLSSDFFVTPGNSPLEPTAPEHWDGSILSAISEVTTRYQPLAKIGTGASAEVFRALDTRFNRHVALKRFNKEALERSDAESDYHSEVAAVSRICHPNVVRAYDLDDDEDGPFIIFELIEGMDLETRLKERALTADEVRHFIVQALEALIAVHQTGLAHLDLKPANFMATNSANGIPHYTLIDFGRACDSEREKDRRESTTKQSLRGSIHYMAPEQFTKGVLDARTDLYALGILAYELLTGQKPFDGDNAIQVMSAHLTSRVTPIDEILPDLPAGMAPWIMALIANNPDARPQTAQEALRSFLSLSTLQFASLEVTEPFPVLDKTA
ncbi:serine/threonine-protein kinase [Roseibacillus persicicus]|uniref:serine/threonine-protein kinase n=1 Tax=Roseibacillus persicicus TaxID=454148 RepID=UPI00280CC550|nr:serine/threonine-protein kinase [Roseibacillus persicicus]MDQ8191417.1 serine/threonine-protein kinase [Roseibacillus persicicus]